jgi:TonB-dependent SusC/RagA subfamily outer membrane receptor
MKNTIIKKLLLTLSCAIVFSLAFPAYGQDSMLSISTTIVDENGAPVGGAKVYLPRGGVATTNNEGQFTVKLDGKDNLVIEKLGYERLVLKVADLKEQLKLSKSMLLTSEDDVVKLGIKTINRREITGSVSTITPKNHLTYDNTQWVRDYIQGLLVGVSGTSNVRGLGDALFVIDGVIGRTPDILNLDEVDQITVLKDANAVALYGSQARNGVIVINTKRGELNKKRSNINVRYGMKTPVSLPKFLNSADYMELFNEARLNDNAKATYDTALISKYRNNSNPYQYPDIDLYSSEYLRPASTFTDVLTEFSDGNDRTKYYVSVGWKNDQSFEKVNPKVNVGSNQFNVRGNIDFVVSEYIKSSIDAVAIISDSRSALNNLYNQGLELKPFAFAPLLPVSMIDTTTNPALVALLLSANQFDGYLLGGSQVYKNAAPLATTIAGGYQNSLFRSTQFNNSIDFDLRKIAKGLTARTYLSFDFYDAYRVTVQNKFKTYEPTWKNDMITKLTPYGDVDMKDLTENVSTNGFVSRMGFYGLLNYARTFNTNHSFNATLLGYGNSSHLGFQAAYDFKKKIFADFSSAYVYSIKLPDGNRGSFAPTFGLAYILSEENFMKQVEAIDFLKIKATGGVVKSDLGIEDYFLYNETYSDGNWIGWADGLGSNRSKNVSQGANSVLTFESRVDLNLGLETFLWNSLWLEFNLFKTDFDNQLSIIDIKYPSYYKPFRPYDNFNKDTYRGFELGFDYTKRVKDFNFTIGGNLMYSVSEITKREEIHEYAHQYRVGTPLNAIYGLQDEGFYALEDFTVSNKGEYTLNAEIPVPSFGAVRPGDIRYTDITNDGVIDNNDQLHIGEWSNPLSYGLNIKLQYKNVSLSVLGVGENGGMGVKYGNYYWVDGNDKYSDVVLNRWTPETVETATYPRLSSKDNKNNFQTSTFWMYNNSYFDIKRAQLTYELSDNVCKKLKMKNMSLNVAGVNIFRFSENKDVQQLNLGYSPNFSYWSLGVRTSF